MAENIVLDKLSIGGRLAFEVLLDLSSMKTSKGTATVGLEVRSHVPKIPREDMMKIVAFFKEVYRLHQAEAVVFLYYAPSLNEWFVVAPPQQVNGGNAKWSTPGAPLNGWFLVGSIHSHHTMSAFHSGTDDKDELDWEGIHITVGKITSPAAEYAASLVINKKRYEITIGDLVEGEPEFEFPGEWMEQVSKIVPKTTVVTYASPT